MVITRLYENVLDRVYISGVASSGVARGAMGVGRPRPGRQNWSYT